MSRTIVIGDIHGGLKALFQVLERAGVSSNDRLIFLGDYVDGWSESAQVIQHLLVLRDRQPCVFIKGNHDVWCEEWLRTSVGDTQWLEHGGRATIESYGSLDATERKQHLVFFESMPYYSIDGENRLYIHAGFTSMHGPAHEFHSTNFSWDRTLWETALAMDSRLEKDARAYPKRLKLFNEIFIGHTPTQYFGVDRPMNAGNVWNIDTGAAFRGRLSVIDVDTKQFWQSDPVHTLYPGEAGRNKVE